MESKIIPKNLFMIWLGDKIPNYVLFSINAYKQANPNFNILLIYYKLKLIEDIYNGKLNTIYDELLHEVIYDILNAKNESILNKEYMYNFRHLVYFYGKELRFILLLSDMYRLRIILNFGGIYVDCDTFPLKPFDEKLLSLEKFMVTRHYNNRASCNIGNDNYFLGSVQNLNMETHQKLLQTNSNWWSNILFLIDKRKFYKLKTKYIKQKNLPFYIEHYCDGNWENKNGIIRTPKCFLDNVYRYEN